MRCARGSLLALASLVLGAAGPLAAQTTSPAERAVEEAKQYAGTTLMITWELLQQRCDLVLSPTMPCTAPPIEPDHDVIAVSTRLSRFTWLWPAAGVPALTVPCGFDAHGQPIGMQLAGPRWSEPLLLRVGHAYQAVTDWRRPAPGEPDEPQGRSNEARR